MKIGILGSGDVGQALARGFAGLDYEVMIGTRDGNADKLKPLLEETGGKKLSVGKFDDVARFGEVVVLAVGGKVIEEALGLAGAKNLAGKTVIDVTNPLDFSAGMPPRLTVGFNNSAGETVQRLLPDAKVVKTLNIVGNSLMVNPKLKQGEPDMLLCGNDDGAKEQVRGILQAFGWKNITDLGKIEQSRIMEPLCVLWVTYAAKYNNWNIAFKMLTE